MDQKHLGSGDNVAGKKIVNIDKQYVTYQNDRKFPRLLTKLPVLSDEIIGRDEQLATLYDTLETAQRVVLMNGMGGIGKTTTAIAYANLNRNRYAHIVWLEQVGEFSTDLAANTLLTNHLGITPSSDTVIDTQLILNTLANMGGKSLLVVDNADGQLKAFKDYFPKAPDWHVLITSREELPFAKNVSLAFLSPDQALKLFYSHYTWDRDDEKAAAVLETLDYHTLTIEILAKTAQNLEINSVERIATLLQERGVKIGKPIDLSSVAHSRDQQNKYLFPYLAAIFQLPELSPDEIYLLKQFIGLPPILLPWEQISELIGFIQEKENRQDELLFARNALRKKGWLIYDAEQQAYKMHRIIQDVLEEKLQPAYEELRTLINGISDLLYFDQAKDNPKDTFPFVVFGERILKLFPSQRDADFTGFQSNIATIYMVLGQYEQARDLLQAALESAIHIFGLAHPNTSRSRSNLALVYQDLGNYEQARDLLRDALDSDIRNFGEDHPSTALRRSNLATVYKDLGDYERARDLLQDALDSAIRSFGEEHPSTALRRSNLATVYRELGDYEQARDLLWDALNSAIQSFGEEHPSTAIRRSNLALVYQDLGDYEQARDLLWVALDSDIRNFGEEHPSTARIRCNLGTVYKDLRDFEMARKLFQMAYDVFKASLGEEHPNSKIVQRWLDGIQ